MSKILRNWFLMDDIPKPYFAISARKIKYKAGGNIATIRREGDDTEQSFGFINDNLDATEINDFIVAGGSPTNGYFTEWYDQLNPANKLIQTNQDWLPLYAENAINNKIGMESVIPVVTLGKLYNNNDLNYSTPATIFCVVDVVGNQGTSGAQPFGTHNLLLNNMFRSYLIGAGYFLQGRDNLGNLFSSSTVASTTGKNIFICVADGIDNIKIYRNGVLEIDYTVVNGFLNTLRKVAVGSFGGFLTEFLIYDSILNEDNRVRVQTALNDYYNIF